MAAAVNNNGFTTSASSTYTTIAGTKKLVVIVCAGGQPSSITFDGASLTKRDSIFESGNGEDTSIWDLDNPTIGAKTLAVNGSSGLGYVGIIELSGVTTGVDAHAGATGSPVSTNPNVSVTTVADNCIVVGGGYAANNSCSANQGTMINSTAPGFGFYCVYSAIKTPPGSQTVGVNCTNGRWGIVAASYAPAPNNPIGKVVQTNQAPIRAAYI